MGKLPRWHRLLDAASQFFNVLIFNGEANYSISGDAYRLHRPRLKRFIDKLMKRWDPDHCRNSYIADIDRAYLLIGDHEKGPSYARKTGT